MTLFEAIQSVIGKYADFEGRARRSEMWWFVLFYILVQVAVGAMDQASHNEVLGTLVSLSFFLPMLAVQVRRLHDIGQSGWWLFLVLLPVVGLILLVVWWCQDGDPRENRFGHDPKGRGAGAGALRPPPQVAA